MDPNNAQPIASPEVPNASPAPEVPPTTPEAATAAPSEHKKSFLDSIMSMFGMGPKEESPSQPEVPANPGTPPSDAAAPAPTPDPANPPAVGLDATPEAPKA